MVSVPWPAPLPSFRQGLNPIEAAPPPGLSALLGGVNDWRGKNRNLLVGIGADLLSGQWGSHTPQGSALDQQQQEKLKAEAKAAEQQNATLAYFAKKYPDLAAAVQAGMPIGQAWQTAMEREAPQAAQAPIEINGQLVDPVTFKVIGDFRTPQGPQAPLSVSPGETLLDPVTHQPIYTGAPTPEKPPAPPTGYRPKADGTGLEFIPGGPADPSTAGKTTEATRRNQQLASVIEPELNSLIGDATKPGTFDALSNPNDQLRAMGGDVALGVGQGPSPEYQQARNSLTTIVASYLYSVSGATANPGEVEKQVEVLTPKFGESAASIAAKKARLQAMVEAVKAAATGTPISIGGQPETADIQSLLDKYK